MKGIGVAIHIFVLLGSMKYIEYKAANCVVGNDSFSFQTNIDAEPACQESQFSLIPLTSMLNIHQNDEGETSSSDLAFEEIEAFMLKLKKLFVMQKMLSNRMQTDIVPDYSGEEVAYAVDAQVDEEPITIPKQSASRLRLFIQTSKGIALLIYLSKQDTPQ